MFAAEIASRCRAGVTARYVGSLRWGAHFACTSAIANSKSGPSDPYSDSVRIDRDNRAFAELHGGCGRNTVAGWPLCGGLEIHQPQYAPMRLATQDRQLAEVFV